MKLEDVALIVCSYGKDNRYTSQEAAVEIIKEMSDGRFTAETPSEIFQINKVQEVIRRYRNGTKLEETTRKVMEIVNELKSDFDGIYYSEVDRIKKHKAPENSVVLYRPQELSSTMRLLRMHILYLIRNETAQPLICKKHKAPSQYPPENVLSSDIIAIVLCSLINDLKAKQII